MNESLGDDPADVLTVRPQLPQETLDDLDYPEREPLLKARREGLPPDFRMRHDKHYVEELMSTPTIGPGAASSTGSRPNNPTPTAAVVDDRKTTADGAPRPFVAAVELTASRLESIVAHGAIARTNAVSPDLVSRTVDAELQRVSRFARAVAISVRRADPIRRPVTAGEIAAAIRSACTRVARLNGLQCVVTTDDGAFAVAVDRALVIQGIAGTIDALLDLVQIAATDDGSDEAGRITVSLQSVKVRPALIIDIAVPTLAWRGAPAHRFFDNNEQDFAAAPAAGILLAAAGYIVRMHGGRIEAQLQGGVSIRYVLPQEAPRAAPAS